MLKVSPAPLPPLAVGVNE
jgi:hypothetical protein